MFNYCFKLFIFCIMCWLYSHSSCFQNINTSLRQDNSSQSATQWRRDAAKFACFVVASYSFTDRTEGKMLSNQSFIGYLWLHTTGLFFCMKDAILSCLGSGTEHVNVILIFIWFGSTQWISSVLLKPLAS